MIVNLRYAAVIGTFHVGFNPQGVAVSPDGARVYVTNISNDNVAVIDTATDTIIATLPVSGSTGVAISPDGNTIYVASAGKVTILKFGQAQTPAISV